MALEEKEHKPSYMSIGEGRSRKLSLQKAKNRKPLQGAERASLQKASKG